MVHCLALILKTYATDKALLFRSILCLSLRLHERYAPLAQRLLLQLVALHLSSGLAVPSGFKELHAQRYQLVVVVSKQEEELGLVLKQPHQLLAMDKFEPRVLAQEKIDLSQFGDDLLGASLFKALAYEVLPR